jgi:hypothetical protein
MSRNLLRLAKIVEDDAGNKASVQGQIDYLIKKIDLLEKKIDTDNKQLYADVVKVNNTVEVNKNVSNNNPVLLLKAKDKNVKRTQIKDVLRKKIDPTLVPVNGMLNAADGAVLVQCKSKDFLKIVEDEIVQKMGEDYEVKIPNEKKPRAKIINIYDVNNCETDDFKDAIVKQNNEIFESVDQINIVKIISAKKNNYKHLIIETNPDIFRKMMEVKKLNVGWNKCAVLESVDLTRCFKCSMYGHIEKYCKKEMVCPKCAGNHKVHDCTSETVKCANCLNCNEKLKLNLNVDHMVFDRECPVFKRKIEMKRKSINYD